MERFVEEALRRWLKRRRRKPLVLRGARQVGKTTLVRRFAAQSGMGLCEVNLERNLYLDEVFKSLDTGRIVRELEALGGVRLAGSILFLDEVQAAPHALLAMRYLYEDRPEIPVLSAGSLLEFALADTLSPCRSGASSTCTWGRCRSASSCALSIRPWSRTWTR